MLFVIDAALNYHKSLTQKHHRFVKITRLNLSERLKIILCYLICWLLLTSIKTAIKSYNVTEQFTDQFGLSI